MTPATKLPFTRKDGLTEHPANRAWFLRNLSCPYCGQDFASVLASDKEHVIGRNFVPRGTLDGAWNLILRACRRCNGLKSDLEDDLSAITMHPDSAGRFACDDPRLAADLRRKAAKAINRRTRRPVAAGEAPLVIRGQMGPLEMTFTMHSPPQAAENRLFGLAQLQLQAFFYRLTFDHEHRRGAFWRGGFQPLLAVRREDWGNPQLLWFEQRTAAWLPRLRAITADGFYKVWIKREAEDRILWAWAMEWNRNFRLAGFFGLDDSAKAIVDDAPPLKLDTLSETPTSWLKVRTEIPLADDADHLFDWDDDVPQSA